MIKAIIIVVECKINRLREMVTRRLDYRKLIVLYLYNPNKIFLSILLQMMSAL